MRHSLVSKGRRYTSAEKIEKDRGVGERTAYKYFIRTSRVSGPPSEPYILLSMGDMSDCLIDCSVSTTVARCTSCPTYQQCAPILNALSRIPDFCSPPQHLISSNWEGGGCWRVGCSPSPARPLRTAHSPKPPLMHPPNLPLVTVA